MPTDVSDKKNPDSAPVYEYYSFSAFTADPESHLIDAIDLSRIFERLSDMDRELLWLRFAYRRPLEYPGLWPASLDEIIDYISTKYGTARSVRTIQRLTTEALQRAKESVTRPTAQKTVWKARGKPAKYTRKTPHVKAFSFQPHNAPRHRDCGPDDF